MGHDRLVNRTPLSDQIDRRASIPRAGERSLGTVVVPGPSSEELTMSGFQTMFFDGYPSLLRVLVVVPVLYTVGDRVRAHSGRALDLANE